MLNTHRQENNLNHQAATRTHGDVLALVEVIDADLETVPTRTGVMIYLESGVEGHVFDLDFVVDGPIRVGHGGRERRAWPGNLKLWCMH